MCYSKEQTDATGVLHSQNNDFNRTDQDQCSIEAFVELSLISVTTRPRKIQARGRIHTVVVPFFKKNRNHIIKENNKVHGGAQGRLDLADTYLACR
jgi:hypothetical protein